MPDILSDLATPALAAAVRANLFGFFLSCEQSAAAEFARLDGFARGFIAHPLALFHGALSRRDASPADGDAIEETLAYFRAKEAGDVCWWLEDGVDPAGWAELLAVRGFALMDGPPGMAVDLAALPALGDLPSAAEVHRIENAAELRPFAHLVTEVFGFPPEAEDVALAFFDGMGLELPSAFYLATVDGVPVGTSQVFYAAGVPGVYNVGVAEGARGKGLGAALTLQPLFDARAMGYRAGVLQSSDMGLSLYRRLGFAQNCRLDYYYLELA